MCECSVVSNSLWPDGLSLPSSSVHRIFQARVPEWVAISFSRGVKGSFPHRWGHWTPNAATLGCFLLHPTSIWPCSLQGGGLATFLPLSFLVSFPSFTLSTEICPVSKPSSNPTFLWLLYIYSISSPQILIASITWHSFSYFMGFCMLFGRLDWVVAKVPSSCRLPSLLYTLTSHLLNQVSTFSLEKIWGEAWAHEFARNQHN